VVEWNDISKDFIKLLW